MTESTGLIPPLWVIGLTVLLSLPVVLIALRARGRPETARCRANREAICWMPKIAVGDF